MKIMKIWRIAFATLATFSLAYCRTTKTKWNR